MKHCYIHIPFCEKICSYCDFCKMFYNPKLCKEYLNDLEKEIKKYYQNEELETIYIGGGTPSCLNIEELESLLRIVNQFKKSTNYEYTIEGNIESLTHEKLILMKKYGINRISIGIESIDSNNLKVLGRSIQKQECIKKIQEIRNLGFDNINLDLMYAIPKENIETLKQDLDFIISLKPDHISTYSLIIEDHTMLKNNHIKNIEEDLDYEMYQIICNTLKKHGYNHYEISNFAKEGKQSRHNLCYWNNKEYYGFGLGASSYRNGFRMTNTRSITNYRKGIQIEKEKLTEEEIIEYEIILKLRLIEGISLKEFEEKYKRPFNDYYDYEPLLKEKVLILEDDYLKIAEEKLYVSNEIIVKLLQNKKEL